ncbi:MAG: MerR family transcriptional regulator [Actinomycetota bacterium]|nr:MerR family transcriptional regulator [Actinomycetota bacterium]
MATIRRARGGERTTRPSARRDPEFPRYVISVAAELAGVHPQTLREYERKGLLEPARTNGGARRYSDADLRLIEEIQRLSAAGLNHTGVKLVLDLTAEQRRMEDELAAELERARATIRRLTATHARALVPYNPDLARLARTGRPGRRFVEE